MKIVKVKWDDVFKVPGLKIDVYSHLTSWSLALRMRKLRQRQVRLHLWTLDSRASVCLPGGHHGYREKKNVPKTTKSNYDPFLPALKNWIDWIVPCARGIWTQSERGRLCTKNKRTLKKEEEKTKPSPPGVSFPRVWKPLGRTVTQKLWADIA